MKDKINNLVYGSPDESALEKMNSSSSLINVDPKEISFPPPSSNASNETISEILKIKQALSDIKWEEETFNKVADDNPVDIFMSAAIQNGLEFDQDYFKNIKNELVSIILNLKYRYNRPRPFQLAKAHGIDFNQVKTKTTKTPSYPSGQAIQAHVIGNILSKMYPKYENLFQNIADRISLSRFQMGVHFISDIIAGKEIAMLIEDKVQMPFEVREMKASSIREITRQFMSESYKTGEPEKLRVLDFDDTIAMTVERVRIETDTGPKLISSQEFATYEPEEGEYLDKNLAFKEFDKVDINSAKPVPFITDLLQSFVTGDSMILVLTARNQIVEPFVLDFLEKQLGISSARERVVVVGVGDKSPEKKVEVIKDYIDKMPSIQFVSFYDDSGKNVIAVKKFLEAEGKRNDVRQVIIDKRGSVKLVKPRDSEEEDIGLREMTRRFLSS